MYGTKTETLSKSRKTRAVINKLNRAMKYLVALAIVLMILQSYYIDGKYSIFNKINSFYFKASKNIGLIVKNVYLEGQNHTPSDQIHTKLNFKIGDSILELDINDLKNKLEELPWVESSIVEKQLPDSILISITERNPIAIKQHAGKLFLIDENGYLIETNNIKEFINLPLFIGEDVELYSSEITKIINENPEIAKKVSAIVRVSGRRWNIHIDNEIEFKLPEDQEFKKSWGKLLSLINSKDLENAKIVDLRIPGKIYVEKKNAD